MGIAEIENAMVDMKVWDLNQRDSKGATPLIWAAKYGNSALAKLLIDQGDVDPTLSDERRMTPLTHAAKAGHLAVVKLLLQRGDVNPDSGDQASQLGPGLDRVKGSGPGRVAQMASPGSPEKPEIKPKELSLLFIKSQDITHIFQNCCEPGTCVITKLVFC